jgi:hypothetical protein
MTMPRIELVCFEGCPNASQARANLREAVEASGQPVTWSEWNLTAESTPADYRRFGSPTVLVNGKDVTGENVSTDAMACRTDGVPSVATIAARIA